MNETVPSNSRYVPLTQQKSCCVPTCISMIMLKNNIPLVPIELLGYELGLVVREESRYLFWNARKGKRPASGWGTQIVKYPPEKAFKKLHIPLKMTLKLVDEIESKDNLLKELKNAEKKDRDILMSLHAGVLNSNDSTGGHIVVFDRVISGKIRMIDPSTNYPKWRLVPLKTIWKAMDTHPTDKGGIWELSRT